MLPSNRSNPRDYRKCALVIGQKMVRLFGRKPREQNITVTAVLLNGWHGNRVEVVGESFYIEAIREAVRNLDRSDGIFDMTAVLMIERDNPHDRNAVGVYLEGAAKCGHLSREDAEEYRPLLEHLARKQRAAACRAIVAGGTSDKPNFGIFLDLAPPDQALPTD